jgi:hypothetical protein
MGQSNADQIAFWNSETGWNAVRHQADLDPISREVGDLLLEASEPQSGGVRGRRLGAGARTPRRALRTSPRRRRFGPASGTG